jgi:type IX secretion system PorP/SprF family membrane protein
MNKLLVISLGFFLWCSGLYAQQDPLFSSYTSNAFLINPAVAGSTGHTDISAFYRWQWMSMPGAPKTFGISSQGVYKDLHGIGGLVFRDVTGPTNRWGGKVAYAFHMPFADKTMRLSIGAAARVARHQIRANEIDFIVKNDQAVYNIDNGVTSADAEFGVYFYTKKLRVGLSAPNLIQTKMDFGAASSSRTPIGQGYRHYYLTAGYKFERPAKKMSIEPSIMLRYSQGVLPQIDGGVTLNLLDEQVGLSVFYRSPGFISVQGKLVFDKVLPLVIGFDFGLTDLQQYTLGSSELIMGYHFAGADRFAPPSPAE